MKMRSPDHSQNNRKQRVRIVVADDNPATLDRLVFILSVRFDVVARAVNGHELVEAVGTFSPSVAVTDLNMPEMNGIEATRRIKKKYPSVQVVILSLDCDPATIDSAFLAGAAGYVEKTAADTELIRTIELVLIGNRTH
jgi:DNA-binding NarL/FixJ family response regulator